MTDDETPTVTYRCDHPECDFSADVGWDEHQAAFVSGRGWWDSKSFCPEHAAALRGGDLSREDVCSTFRRSSSTDDNTDFIQMQGSRRSGFPPSIEDGEDLGTFPIDEYHSKTKRRGTCPHDGCDFRGTAVQYSGHNCPHMCPDCGGIVHAR